MVKEEEKEGGAWNYSSWNNRRERERRERRRERGRRGREEERKSQWVAIIMTTTITNGGFHDTSATLRISETQTIFQFTQNFSPASHISMHFPFFIFPTIHCNYYFNKNNHIALPFFLSLSSIHTILSHSLSHGR